MSFFPWTRQQFIELVKKITPGNYWYPLESEANGQGMDPYEAAGATFQRLSEAANVNQQAYYIRPTSYQTEIPASGEAKATVQILLRRDSSAGAVTIPAGTRFVSDVHAIDGSIENGELFELTSDVVFAIGDIGPIVVTLQAVRVGYQGNILAGSLNRFAPLGSFVAVNAQITGPRTIQCSVTGDRILPTMVGRYFRFISGANANSVPRRISYVASGSTVDVIEFEGPVAVYPGVASAEVEEWSELGLTFEQLTPGTGGRHGTLDELGQERNVGRQDGETDDAYRKRILSVADVVSPGAIYRTVARILTPFDIGFEIRETRAPGQFIGFVWDVSPYDYFGITDPLSPVYIGPASDTRFYLVLIEQGMQGDYGFFYDAAMPNNAYDATNILNFYDGHPVIWEGLVRAISQSLNQANAAGIRYQIVRYT